MVPGPPAPRRPHRGRQPPLPRRPRQATLHPATPSSTPPAGRASPREARNPPAGLDLFRETVVLRKSRRGSSLLLWAGVGGVAALGLWSVTASIAETIAVPGKLEPSSSVKEVDSPVPGVVEEVLVKEGQAVTRGQPLIRFDLSKPRSELAAAESIRERLLNENLSSPAPPWASRPPPPASPPTSGASCGIGPASSAVAWRPPGRSWPRASPAWTATGTSSASTPTSRRRYQSLVSEGAVSEVQLLEARNKMQDLRSSVAEEEREIARLRSQLVDTGSGTDVELRTTIEANLRQISELDAQIRQARLQIQYGVLTAPSDGVVFDIEASSGSVVGANETTPLLKVVPQESLRAKVYLPNKAIGFVQVGQTADISIETFPANDFGYVPAKVERIGSDALTPEEQTKVLGTQVEGLHFPVILKLGRQSLPLPDSSSVPLQAGMALTADIKLRERKVISLLTGLFEDQRRNLQRLRAN